MAEYLIGEKLRPVQVKILPRNFNKIIELNFFNFSQKIVIDKSNFSSQTEILEL